GDTQPKYDLDQAKKLLAEGLKELGMDKMPKFTMIGDDDDTAKKSIQFIQGAFQQGLGIEADVQPMPKKLRLERQTNGDFDLIAPSRWGADYNDPATFLDQWITGGSFNTIGYSNPEYDKLVNGAHDEPDAKKRSDMLAQAEKILMQDMPIGPLYYLSRSYLKRPSLDGIIFMPLNGQYELKWASVK
ncbi:MAG: ABC transporter substrate-binding protein, partial [Tumebacillaceae bacterium]